MSRCGEKTEVYSRVTGYFRPISNWNKGKQEEFKDRLPFKVGKPDPEGEIVKAEFEVECDRCGLPIHVGEECRVIMDSEKKRAFFFHLSCPTGMAIRCPKKPDAPKLKCALALA